MNKYVIVEWPDIQVLMTKSGFNEHACLINNDDEWVSKYGSSSYFVEEEWLNRISYES